jgi:single-stranded-DNA-specific exonuclease
VWGQGLPRPRSTTSSRCDAQRVVGERHLRMTLAAEGERFEAIAFNQAAAFPPASRALYRPEVGEWNGLLGLELVSSHWEACLIAPHRVRP